MPCSEYYEERLPLLHSDSHKDVETEKEDEKVLCRHLPARFVLVATGFWACLILFSARASFSVAVVAMVNSTSSSTSQGEDGGSNDSVLLGGQERSTTEDPEGDFNWDETTQGLILGAFFYGYFWPQLLFGHLTHKIGGRRTMALGLIGSCALNLVIPVAARAGVGAFVAVRFLQGIVESTTFPAMHSLLGLWSPSQERSRLSNLTYLGVEIGTVIGMMTSGLLSQYGFAGGWPSIFYIHGTVGCVLGVTWLCLVYDNPADHPRMTRKEREYISRTMVHKENVPTPWRHIVTSPAVWAVNAVHFVTSWGLIGMTIMLPSYMSSILHFDIEQNGFLSSVPFVAQLCIEVVGSVTLDYLHNRNITRHSRKLFMTVGAILTAAFAISTGYVPEGSPMLAVVFLSLSMGCSAMCMCCMRVGHLDIAPRFGGSLYALTNTFANMSGFIAPAIVGALTQNEQTIEQWRIFFYINASMYVAGALVFLLLGRTEEQEWAKASFNYSYRRLSGKVEEDANSNKI